MLAVDTSDLIATLAQLAPHIAEHATSAVAVTADMLGQRTQADSQSAVLVSGWVQAAVGVIVGLGAATVTGMFSLHRDRRLERAQRKTVMLEYAGALSDMAKIIGDVLNGDPERAKLVPSGEARLESARRDFNQYVMEFYGAEDFENLRYPRFPTSEYADAISDEAMNHYSRLSQIVEGYFYGTQRAPKRSFPSS
jgi:hypothetical protein